MKTLIVFTISLCLLTACTQPTAAEIEALISKSESLQRVNKLCLELPKPRNFELTRKGLTGNSEKQSIVFYYMTDVPREDIFEFFVIWGKENGWDQTGYGLEFAKERQIVIVDRATVDPLSNVAIFCEESYR